MCTIPRIDMVNTGINITKLRKANNLSVKEVQEVLGFNSPQALYKWERGDCLPTLDNLVILAELFQVTLNEILIITKDDG
ncbi:MAG: helix-turn-helix transcriptional regulator [Erysipelotrichaceae bacterium]|nr:helix-turn-helix transcriptional regulator [Erysipelotrichaceae bacterium]